MTFAHPEWLLLLVAIPVIGLASWLAWMKRGDRWKKLVAGRLRRRLSNSRPAWVHFVGLGLALIGLSGLIIALAQPESGEEWITAESEGRNILFCIDISRSMLTQDVAPSRLLAARAAALEILEQFPNDRVGVLLFSGEVLVQAPLTIDHGFVEQTLAQLEPDDIPEGGSDLTLAITRGASLLAGTGQRSNIMVIFSDGEKSSTGLDAAAAQAADAGIFIYALGFGKDGGFIPDPKQRDGRFRDRDGRPVFSKLDEDSLRGIAEQTEGFYSRGIGRDFLKKLDRALDEMDRFEETGKNQRVAKPAHQWFVVGGLLFLMFSLILRCFPIRSVAVVLAFFVFTPETKASLIGEGRDALEQGDFSGAHRAFESAASEETGERAARLHLAAGSAAFQAKDWTPAVNSFSAALAAEDLNLQHEAHYGLATSLFYLGAPLQGEEQTNAWKGSAKHFQHALELDPDDTRASDNLKIVESLLRKKQEKEQQKKDSDEQTKPDEQKDSNEEKDPEEQKNQDESGESGDQKESDQEENPGDGQKPDDQEDSEGEQKPEDQSGSGDQEEPGEDSASGNQEKSDEQTDSKDPSEESGEEETSGEKPGDPPQESQSQPGDSDNPSGEESKEQGSTDGQLPPPVNESPEERARRLLKQFSDFGGKPPRYIKRPFRRAAHDW